LAPTTKCNSNTKTKQEEKHLKPLKHNQEEVFETFETKPKETFGTIEMNLGPLIYNLEKALGTIG